MSAPRRCKAKLLRVTGRCSFRRAAGDRLYCRRHRQSAERFRVPRTPESSSGDGRMKESSGLPGPGVSTVLVGIPLGGNCVNDTGEDR